MDFLEDPPKPSKKTAQYRAKAARFAAAKKLRKEVLQPGVGPRLPIRIIKPTKVCIGYAAPI